MVGDVGGTNTRLALCENDAVVPQTVCNFANDEWPHLYSVISGYLEDHDVTLTDMAIAVAGPVRGDSARLTNRDWAIERSELIAMFGCSDAFLLNDLSALGCAVHALKPTQLHMVHDGGQAQAGAQQSLVVGIGTGFNVSPVLQTEAGVHCLTTEAGHISMPTSITQMLKSLSLNAFDFPTIEDLFSGRGFTRFCQAISSDASLEGKNVIQRHRQTDDPAARQAVDNYAGLLGQLLRELSLGYMPSEGIYLAGSVGRAIGHAAPQSCLRTYTQHCSVKGDHIASLFIIEDDFAALAGCAVFGA